MYVLARNLFDFTEMAIGKCSKLCEYGGHCLLKTTDLDTINRMYKDFWELPDEPAKMPTQRLASIKELLENTEKLKVGRCLINLFFFVIEAILKNNSTRLNFRPTNVKFN